jgi:DNA-dependent RNA polymerase auxiliary subunit epsilon
MLSLYHTFSSLLKEQQSQRETHRKLEDKKYSIEIMDSEID